MAGALQVTVRISGVPELVAAIDTLADPAQVQLLLVPACRKAADLLVGRTKALMVAVGHGRSGERAGDFVSREDRERSAAVVVAVGGHPVVRGVIFGSVHDKERPRRYRSGKRGTYKGLNQFPTYRRPPVPWQAADDEREAILAAFSDELDTILRNAQLT